MVTCDQQEKVAYSPKVSLENFLQITNSFWRYAELNRLLVGSSEIPILWELQQDDLTVCCSHTNVPTELDTYNDGWLVSMLYNIFYSFIQNFQISSE